jgi:flagellar hook-associated protein 1 FlgK
VNTPGFSRQEAILEIASPVAMRGGFLGRGVIVSGIKRYYDKFIQTQLLGQYQNFGRSSSINNTLSQIEQVFNEAGNMGLSAPLLDFFNAWNEVAGKPEGVVERNVLLQKAQSLVLTAKQMDRSITAVMKNTNEAIGEMVDRINSLASGIANLNSEIVQIEAGSLSESANDLRDQRDALLGELSNLIDFSSYEDKNGAVNISVGMRNLVYGEKTNTLSARLNEDGYSDLSLDGINITDNIKKGEIGGLLAVRDDVKISSLDGLRRLIASLIKEINSMHRQGYSLDGSTGNDFFAPLQLTVRDSSPGATLSATITDPAQVTLDEYSVRFDAANNYLIYNKQTGALVTSGAYVSGSPISFDGIEISITGPVTSTDKFTVSPLTDVIRNFGVAITNQQQIAAASSSSGLPGDNAIALKIAQLSENAITSLRGATFTSFYAGLVSSIGTMSRAASDSLSFDDNLLSEIKNRRESISGVSLEEEAANLIKFQRSFEAGARMIKVTDELLQTILNL